MYLFRYTIIHISSKKSQVAGTLGNFTSSEFEAEVVKKHFKLTPEIELIDKSVILWFFPFIFPLCI